MDDRARTFITDPQNASARPRVTMRCLLFQSYFSFPIRTTHLMQVCGVCASKIHCMRARRRCLGWLEAMWSTTRSRASMHRSLRTGRPAPARPSPWWGTTASRESSHDCARASLSGIFRASDFIIHDDDICRIRSDANPNVEYQVKASYYEIYNERVSSLQCYIGNNKEHIQYAGSRSVGNWKQNQVFTRARAC